MALNRTDLSSAVKTYFEKRLLVRAQPRMPHSQFGMQATFVGGNVYELRRYSQMAATTTALTEGVTPAEAAAPTITIVNITPLWYGAFLRFTDAFEMQSFDPVLSNFSSILGDHAGLSIDTIVRDVLTDGATTDFAGGATVRTGIDQTNDKVAYVDIVQNVAQLEANNARPADAQDFACILHPHTWATLMQDATFLTVFTREGGDSVRSGYIGRFLNCKLYISANARMYDNGGAGSIDVYDMLFIGSDAYGIAGVTSLMPDFGAMDSGGDGYSNRTGEETRPVEIIVKDLGQGGDDPMNQRGSMAWKAAFASAVTNANFVRNLEHATDFTA